MHDRHILVVEDDPRIAALLRRSFEAEGAQVSEARDLVSVERAMARQDPDLITLDIGLGDENGLDIVRAVRTRSDTPIIVVTGKDDVIDRVVGLELGADDYVTKPFHMREMLARVKSILRRAGRAAAPGPSSAASSGGRGVSALDLDGLLIDLGRMSVLDRHGGDCGLTTADFKLLQAFLDNAQRPLSRDRLMTLVDGPAWVPLDRTIDNQVARLRKKIERDPAQPRLIKTVRGVGYMLTEVARRKGQDNVSSA